MASSIGSSPLFLGLDLSTQQLKGVLVDSNGRIVKEINIVFDRQFPSYKTVNGRHAQGDVATAPVYMWVEAIDELMAAVSRTGLAGRVSAISGAAQQHGSVYWTGQGVEKLGLLDSQSPLKAQLESAGAFAVLDSPTWEDSSTGKQCRQLESAAGGAAELARITGSVAFERFTGAQIAKIKETQPRVWQDIARISLVSSFAASVLAGAIVPADVSDASGTNLFDIQAGEWSRSLCDSIDLNLHSILGTSTAMADSRVGFLSPYYTERYGFQGCPVLAFTGDNPSAYAGFESFLKPLGCSAAVVSLGTSDTVQFPQSTYPYLRKSSPSATTTFVGGHVLAHPTAPGKFVTMLCYKNGSLAREWVRDNCAGLDGSWESFNEAASTDEPLAPSAFGFYYLSTEILPKARGIHRFERCKQGGVIAPSGARFRQVHEFSADVAAHASDARAVIESQLLSMRLDHSRKSNTRPQGIVVTGGASANPVLRQTIADVFGVPAFALGVQGGHGFVEKTPAMPAYGGAIRAMEHCALNEADGSGYVLQPACYPCSQSYARYTQALADFEFLRNYVSRR